MEKSKITEALLVLTTGFLVIFLFSEINLFLFMALVFGITGIALKPVARYIALAWYKLADMLGYVTSRVLLGILFFTVLFPISLLYRISNKDRLRLKRSPESGWIERNHHYTSGEFTKTW